MHMAISILSLIFLGLDLATKWLVEHYVPSPIEIWPGIFRLARSYNPGVAFSIPIPNQVMLFATPLLLFAVGYVIFRSFKIEHCATKIILALFIAGGLGNLINRIWIGAVIDFIDFSFWPSFNLADSYLTIAAFLLIAFYGKINKTSYG